MIEYDPSEDVKKYACHFTGMDSLIKILKSDALRFGFLGNTNDISESAFNHTISMFPDSHLPLHKRPEWQAIHLEGTKGYNYEFKSRRFISVTELSTSVRSYVKHEVILSCLPMWTHYAKSNCTHGASLVFDFDKLNQLFDSMSSNFESCRKKVDYVNLINGNYTGDALFAKDKCWSYEREYRYLMVNKNPYAQNFINGISKCIDFIVLGFGNYPDSMSSHYLKDYAVQLARNLNPDIYIFQALFDKDMQAGYGMSNGLTFEKL